LPPLGPCSFDGANRHEYERLTDIHAKVAMEGQEKKRAGTSRPLVDRGDGGARL
jgi:hypothetical protein